MTLRFTFYLMLICIGFITGIARFRKLAIPVKYLVIFLLVTFISEITSRVLAYKNHNSFPVYHFYVLLLVPFFSFIYLHFISSKKLKIIIVAFCSIFLAFSILNTIFFQPLNSFPSISIIAADLLIVIYSMFHFKDIIDKKSINEKKHIIILNIIIMLYFTVQLFNWGFYNYLLTNKLNTKIISDFGYISNVIFYSSVAMIIYKIPNKDA